MDGGGCCGCPTPPRALCERVGLPTLRATTPLQVRHPERPCFLQRAEGSPAPQPPRASPSTTRKWGFQLRGCPTLLALFARGWASRLYSQPHPRKCVIPNARAFSNGRRDLPHHSPRAPARPLLGSGDIDSAVAPPSSRTLREGGPRLNSNKDFDSFQGRQQSLKTYVSAVGAEEATGDPAAASSPITPMLKTVMPPSTEA